MSDFLKAPVQMQVQDFRIDDTFTGFLMVKRAERRVGSNNNAYFDLDLADNSGTINAKLWNVAPNTELPAIGSIIKVEGLVKEFSGRKQFRVDRWRPSHDADRINMEDFIACAPEDPEQMYQTLLTAAKHMKNRVLNQIVVHLLEKLREPLLFYPAAQRMHHAMRSGLLYHTTSMLKVAEAILPCYPRLDGDLLRAGIIMHDLFKITEFASDPFGNVKDYTMDGLLLGHLVRGVASVQEAAKELGIAPNEEYLLLLEHMIISHHGKAEYGSVRPPMFPEAELLHYIDNIDAKLNQFYSILDRTPAGVFSEHIAPLERRVYHPQYQTDEA